MVGLVIILAGAISVFVLGLSDEVLTDEPQFSAIEISDAAASENDFYVSQLDDGNQCVYYHVVITIDHIAGDSVQSDDLEYFVEIAGEEETLSGRFVSTDAAPGVVVDSGDQILLALDGDTNEDDCGEATAEESFVAAVFGDEAAWSPSQPDGDDFGNIHNTFLEIDSPDDIESVSVTIIQDSTRTTIIDDETTEIRDVS